MTRGPSEISKDFFPEGELGAILVNGRHAHLRQLVNEHSANYIQMPGLEKDAALDLLIKQSGNEDLSTEDSVDIVRRLGFHPLALAQAAAYTQEQNISFSKFLEKYKRQRRLILDNTPTISEYRKKIGDAEKETSLNVFTTWEFSLQQLQSSATEPRVEETLLTLFAFFNEQDISEELLSIALRKQSFIPGLPELAERLKIFTDHSCHWDSDLFKNVLIRLKNLCLLQSFAEGPDDYYHASLHPLVKDWIQLRMNKSDYQKTTFAAMSMLTSTVIHHIPDRSSSLSFYTRQILSGHIMAHEENIVTLFESSPAMLLDGVYLNLYLNTFAIFVDFYVVTGSYGAAESLNRRFLVLGETYLKLDNPQLMVIQHDMAKILVLQKRLDEAEKLYLQVIETRKKCWVLSI